MRDKQPITSANLIKTRPIAIVEVDHAHRGRGHREETRFCSLAIRKKHLEEGRRLNALNISRAAKRATFLVTLAGLTVVLGGCERWALDRQMEEMCRKDGGVKVYEKVRDPGIEFSNGALSPRAQRPQGHDALCPSVGEGAAGCGFGDREEALSGSGTRGQGGVMVKARAGFGSLRMA